MDINEDSSVESDAEGNLNFLCKPVFKECSDLPNFSRIGIFSCDKCDRWRGRYLNYRKCNKSRSEMPSHQCTRVKKGAPGIKVRVVHKNNNAIVRPKLESKQVDPIEDGGRKSCRLKKRKLFFDNVSEYPKRKVTGKKNNSNHDRNKDVLECKRKIVAEELMKRLEQEQRHKKELSNLQAKLICTKEEAATEQLEQEQLYNKEINKLRVELNQARQASYKAKSRMKNRDSNKGVTAIDKFCQVIEKTCFELMPEKHSKTKAQFVLSALQSNEKLLNGEISAALFEDHKKRIKYMFRPSRVVKACDLGPIGSFRTGTVSSLRDIIDQSNDGFFPSTSAVSRARVALDKHALNVVGWRKEDTRYGEVFFLNKENALRALLKATNLHELATKESVKISFCVDGADLVRDRTHVSAGVKITDERGTHPVTKQPLLMVDEDGKESFVNVQSHQMCCVMVIADARDKKELYEDVFRDFYDWGRQLAVNGIPATDTEPALRPFTVTHGSDMKAQWMLSNRGGGCKNKRFFCTFCSCTKENLLSYRELADRCDRCKRRNKDRCYHHDVLDTITVTRLLEELEKVLAHYNERHGKTYAEVKLESRLNTDHMQANKSTDVRHVDFSIEGASPEQVRQYAQFISRECTIRGIPLDGSISDWQAALKSSVALERGLELLDLSRQWHESGRTEVPLVDIIEILIPCILHLENRCNEKIITTILRCGFDKHIGPKLGFISEVQQCIQRQVLGTETRPSQWKLKYSQPVNDTIQLDNVQFRNETGRVFLRGIDSLIECAIKDEQFRRKLVYAVSQYTQGMCLLTLHRSLDEEEKELFQCHMDDFFVAWAELFGREGQSNYIHMIGSGHTLFFLKQYNCLYLYSQQGWEALNNRIQTYIHQSSGRGGHNTGVDGSQSYIFPVVRFVLRDLMWKTGEADRFFAEMERNI